MHLKSFSYTSWARPGIETDEVEAILRSSRTNNPLDGISGILLFNGTAFMQILEGDETAIEGLIKRLYNDTRHSNMSIHAERRIEVRTFPDWSMAFLQLDSGKFHGEDELARTLRRELPQSLRNLVMGLTHSVVQPPLP